MSSKDKNEATDSSTKNRESNAIQKSKPVSEWLARNRGKILAAFFTSIVTIPSSLFIGWWQFVTPELKYTTEQFPPFEGTDSKIANYKIRLWNAGNQVGNEVECDIDFGSTEIDRYHIEPEGLDIKPKLSGNKIKFEHSYINANSEEIIEVRVLGSTAGVLVAKPNVVFRCNGSTGEEIELTADHNSLTLLNGLFVFGGGVIFIVILFLVITIVDSWVYDRRRKKRDEEYRNSPEYKLERERNPLEEMKFFKEYYEHRMSEFQSKIIEIDRVLGEPEGKSNDSRRRKTTATRKGDGNKPAAEESDELSPST